jgi:hypothetical protein
MVVLSFWAMTWFVSDHLFDPSTSSLPIIPNMTALIPEHTAAPAAGPAVTQETSLADLPKHAESAIGWAGIEGLNAQLVDGTPAVTGQPILRLIAIPTDGPHTLAVHFTALQDRIYRIAAWAKPDAGSNFGIEASDLAATGATHGFGVFDLRDPSVLSSASAKAGVEQGPGTWQKVWIDLPTSTGQFVVNLYVYMGTTNTFKGDGIIGVTLGGIAAEPLMTLTARNIVLGVAVLVLLFWATWFVLDRLAGTFEVITARRREHESS